MHIRVSKRIQRVIILLVLLVKGFAAYAADISALDFNGNVLGKVIPDGSVINFDNDTVGEVIGHITADGLVLNNEEDVIGGIVPQGIAISINNTVLGKVNNDGSVTSINDSLVGKVLPNGLVVNNNYDIIGAIIAPGLVYDDNGNIIGRISGDGKFYHILGESNGFVTSSGYVYITTGIDQKLALSGKLISSKIVISSTGKFLGSISPDGKVVDLKKNTIGTIHANGFVYNANGVAIGHTVESGFAFSFDGTYLGVVSYNGEVIYKGKTVAQVTFNNRVVDKEGNIIGFSINMAATANTLDGKYLGRVVLNGEIARGRDIVGKIGAAGSVINSKGEVIGLINQTGPIFDYLGQVRANAAVDGSVVSLDGSVIGYMQKKRAFDYKEKEIGKVLSFTLNFDNINAFIGMSGITSNLNYNGKIVTISPYGYVLDENGVIGRNYEFSNIYSPDGAILANVSSNGRTENLTLNDKAKLTSGGYFVDKSDKVLGSVLQEQYATNFNGNNLGAINTTNLIIDAKNIPYAKILPTKNVISLSSNNKQTYGRAGDNTLSVSINGDYLGANMVDGQVRKNGEIIGKISSNQYVIDNQGALYGKTVPFGVVVNSECKFLGVVSDNGDARTSSGTYLGMVLANNQVVSDAEEVIGYIINPKVISGKAGETIGTQTPIGTVLNYKNQNLGCQGIDGKIRNNQKEVVGQIVTNASVMDFENNIIGYTNLNGKIVNSTDSEIGYIDLDGGIQSLSDKEDIGVLFRYTVAFNSDNTYLGRVNLEGDVIADSGEVIGKVNYNGAVNTKDGKQGFALYDLYVYDNDGKTVGYITKNGRVYSIMGEMKGSIYNGFVLDKKQNLIARGSRDYDIRDENKKVIGYLGLDGRVINSKNIEVGYLENDGKILDNEGNILAIADSLQYYSGKKNTQTTTKNIEKEDEEVIEESIEEESIDDTPKQEEITEDDFAEIIPDSNEIVEDKSKNPQNIIGIAMMPNGKYLGEINNKKEVLDKNGNVVGFVDENGQIVDRNGNVIGIFESEQAEKPKATNSKWWHNVINGVTISPYDDTNTISNVGAGGGIGPGGRYNPRRAAIINQLQNSRRQVISGKKVSNGSDISSYTGWQDDWSSLGFSKSISSLRVDMSNMITADKPIPAVLARSLISLGDAPITAIVERNVYGDAGRNVIIPAGSRIIGGLQSITTTDRFNEESGGVKMEITWNRIIRPDGIAFDISSAQTGDAEGRGGGALGYVDEQLLKKYTVPLLGTMATSAVAYLMAANQDATGEVETSKQQAASDARQNFLDKMDEILDKIIESKEQIQAVTYVPAGTRVIIYPMTDLWLRTTKDVLENNQSNIDERAKDVLIDENDNNKNEQKNVQGKGQPTQNNANTPTPLIEEGNNKQNQQNNNRTGALPPPSADGTGMPMPESEEDDDDGEIDLDF